jgi:hypothetical protein
MYEVFMKIFQNKFVRSLPKVILFGIAFYNFAWCYWQCLDSMAGRGIASPWYSTKDFPLAQFLLVIASYSLFIKNRWSYFAGFLISGFCLINFISILIPWFIRSEDKIYPLFESVNVQFHDNNPLTVWESQPAIAATIFSLSIYCLLKELTAKKPKTLL